MKNFLNKATARCFGTVVLIAVQPIVASAQEAETPPIVSDVLEKPALTIKDISRVMMIGVSAYKDGYAAVGERGSIVLSAGGDESWTQAEYVPVSVSLTDIRFTNSDTGWATGHSGVLLRSGDGGQNWDLVFDGRGVAQIILDEASKRAAEGIEGADREVRTAQYLVEEGPDKPLLKVFFISPEKGWVLGAYGIALETSDGGVSWASVGHRIPNIFGAHLYDMAQVGSRLIITGEQGAVFVSEDEGETFFKVESDYEGTFFGVEPETDETAIFHGLRGNVWRLTFEPVAVIGESDAASEENGDDNEEDTAVIPRDYYWTNIDNGPEVTVSAAGGLGDGRVLLADQGGRFTISDSQADSAHSIQENGGGAVNDLVVTRQGAVIVVGPRGPIRIDISGEE